MTTLFSPALRLLILLTLLTGAAYPALGTWLAQSLFPAQANGSLVYAQQRTVGSALIGQSFTRADYFWSRPSAIAYDATNSGGSNFGPLNPQLLQALMARRQALAPTNPPRLIPVELLTSSASGLDPHLSPGALRFQVDRVAHARHLPAAQLQQLITRLTTPTWPLPFERQVVNVLQLNLALDQLATQPAQGVQ